MANQETSSRHLTVDRIVEQTAVLVDESRQVEIPLAWLPEGCVEGTLLTLTLARCSDAEQQALIDRIKALQSRFTRPPTKS